MLVVHWVKPDVTSHKRGNKVVAFYPGVVQITFECLEYIEQIRFCQISLKCLEIDSECCRKQLVLSDYLLETQHEPDVSDQ